MHESYPRAEWANPHELADKFASECADPAIVPSETRIEIAERIEHIPGLAAPERRCEYAMYRLAYMSRTAGD
jgi:hypothetical protein